MTHWTRVVRRSANLLLLALAFIPARLAAQPAEDDDEDSRPGLIAAYTAGEKTVERIDPDVQFVWEAASPDARLPAAPFSAHWTGKLLIRTEGKHAFHLFVHGEARVTLNGKTVVSGRREAPGWVAGEATEIDFGEQSIEVAYKRTGPKGALRLFWSSESFPTEPIPPQLLFHDDARPELDLIERGRDLYETHRCQACHRRENEAPVELAPALAGLPGAVERDWLIDWLVEPHGVASSARMPAFGFSRDEARAVAEYLVSPPNDAPLPRDADLKLPDGVDQEKEVARRGEILFRSLGCLACHTRGTEGSASLQGGGDLTNVGRKRSAGWVFRLLQEPEKLNADHRMPVFKLADDERRSLALFLAGPHSAVAKPPVPAGPRDAALLAAGKKLIEAARCSACHRLPGFETRTTDLPSLEKPVGNWTKSCLAASDPNHSRPAYVLNDADQKAVRAFVESRVGRLAVDSPFAHGQRLIRRKGCLNCHPRDGGRGIAALAGAAARLDPDLAGQSEALVPPDLSAVGDKLRDEPLAAAIVGKQQTSRLPWLRVRMPRFEHSPAAAESLVAYFVGHDRIPDGAPRSVEASESTADGGDPKSRDELRRAGQVLAGTRGFSCTACHKIAGHEPRNVALATRGSDLYLIGARMRPEFFVRWTRSPLRIIPGMEMPSFERSIAGILDAKLDRQLAALWEALNDRSAPPKLDTSTIEQVLAVAPGERARIVRDVFNVGDPLSPRFVPRAFAVGFENSVNLLFDLDGMALSHHWYGDFARQRASGKSWFWEPAAGRVVAAAANSPDIALRRRGDSQSPPVIARKESGRFGRLVRYERGALADAGENAGADQGVRIEYRLTFDLESGPAVVDVSELLVPTKDVHQSSRVACRRDVRVRPVPDGYDVVLRVPANGRQDGLYEPLATHTKTRVATGGSEYVHETSARDPVPAPPSLPLPQIERVMSVPGYDGVRLPLAASIMPTAITWTADGTLAFCSLKGQVFLARDSDGDGFEDSLTVFEEGLAAPYGLIADGKDLIVAHKPELLRLRDTDGDGRADVRELVADGWGYTEDYHDWTMGIVRDSRGNLYVGTGSDYAKRGRDREKSRWRGKVLRIDPAGTVTPLGHAFRYPTGLAITPDDQVFVSDNQGVQNTFNEINHLVAGASYGVPSLYEESPAAPATPPAIQVPHPWTRSVNGIFFLPRSSAPAAFAGHGIGCEYDSRFLVRFTLQRVGDTYQGAVYPFSQPTAPGSRDGFIGTLCGAVSPQGDIYIGSIHDSGWLGGANVGDIVRLRPAGKLPAGIREIRAGTEMFTIFFTAAIDRTAAARPESYEIAGYTRKWQGAYATPDSGRHKLEVQSVDVARDGLSVTLHTPRQQTGYVYEITCGRIGPPDQPALWPGIGHYTLNRLPAGAQ